MRYLQPGMSAVDVGANVGVYALALARAVGPGGRVVAYEPATTTRGFLEKGRALSGLANLP